MRLRSSCRSLPALAMFAALAAFAAAHPTLAQRRTVDETRAVQADVRIEIQNVAGEVIVRGWDRNEVHVQGTLGDDVEDLILEGGASSLRIEVEIPNNSRGRRDIEAYLEIQVPRGARLDVETVSAGIEVTQVDGDMKIASVSGSLEIAGSPAEVQAESVSGSIRIRGDGTRISAESVSGSVTVEGAAGRVDVSSVSGNVETRAAEIQEGSFESVSGRVELHGRLSPSAQIDIESHSGNVELYLPADTSASFEVETFSGDIDNDLGPDARRVDRYTPSKRLEFTSGSGSARVRVSTFSGNVRLHAE